MRHRFVEWSAIAACIAVAATVMIWWTRKYERQGTLHDLELDLGAARASTQRYDAVLSAVRRRADRLRSHADPAVRSMYPAVRSLELAIQERRNEALFRELNARVNYESTVFSSDDLVVLTNYSIVAEATDVMTRLSNAGIKTQIKYIYAGTDQLPRSCHLLVRRVDEFKARQALRLVLSEDGGAGHQE